MSLVRKPDPIAIIISDLHLTLLQPACRADKDWMGVQASYLQQVKDWAEEESQKEADRLDTDAEPFPILCAGDIFDKWNAPPELINFALEHLPDGMFCIPGQHDLPLHRMDLMHRSGYGVLKRVGKIEDLSRGVFCHIKGMATVKGFGWNEPLIYERDPFLKEGGNPLHIALIHRYVWTKDKSYPGAPAASNVSSFKKDLKGYDVACFGDNHQGFLATAGDCTVLNVGGFIRRKSDEIDYEPSVGILYADGTVKRRRLDTSIDRFHQVDEKRKEVPFNMKDFIEGLEGLGEHGLDFKLAVEQHLKGDAVDPRTAKIILQAIEAK